MIKSTFVISLFLFVLAGKAQDVGHFGPVIQNPCLSNPCINVSNSWCKTSPNNAYRCKCYSGYERTDINGNEQCQDINECQNDIIYSTTGSNAICHNTPGSYTCTCNSGYTSLRADNCSCNDTDECKQQPKPCEHICNNTAGSYTCSCDMGFIKSSTDETKCLDIDECKKIPYPCEQLCVNSPGSFECGCGPQFKLKDDNRTCTRYPLCNNFKELEEKISNLENRVNSLKGRLQTPRATEER